jgi:uncharacterized protein (DUF488 family)
MATIFTLGHSTRDLADFSRVLQAHDIRLLVDIRAYPASRRSPHFNRQNLALWLPEIGSDYLWEKDLGGKRGSLLPADQSPHVALRDEAWRNYADYMLTEPFQAAIERLLEHGKRSNTAIMCAELQFSRCHRRLVSDFLVGRGHAVLHIVDENPPAEHTLSPEARIIEGRLIYRGDYLL